MANMHNPPHAGRILKELFPDRSVAEVAARLGVSAEYLSDVFHSRYGMRACGVSTDVRNVEDD